jgi:hypothetical protein
MIGQANRLLSDSIPGRVEEKPRPPHEELLQAGSLAFQHPEMAQKRPPYSLSEQFLLLQLSELVEEVKGLNNNLKALINDNPTILREKIYSIPSEDYELRNAIDIILKIYPDEVLALIPELEIYGEGRNEFEAVKILKLELIDLLEDIYEVPEDELGDAPKLWKKTLKSMVTQCQ